MTCKCTSVNVFSGRKTRSCWRFSFEDVYYSKASNIKWERRSERRKDWKRRDKTLIIRGNWLSYVDNSGDQKGAISFNEKMDPACWIRDQGTKINSLLWQRQSLARKYSRQWHAVHNSKVTYNKMMGQMFVGKWFEEIETNHDSPSDNKTYYSYSTDTVLDRRDRKNQNRGFRNPSV